MYNVDGKISDSSKIFGNLFSDVNGTSHISGNGSYHYLVFRGIGAGIYCSTNNQDSFYRIRVVWYLEGVYKAVRTRFLSKLKLKGIEHNNENRYSSFAIEYGNPHYREPWLLINYLTQSLIMAETIYGITIRSFFDLWKCGVDKGLDYLMSTNYKDAFDCSALNKLDTKEPWYNKGDKVKFISPPPGLNTINAKETNGIISGVTKGSGFNVYSIENNCYNYFGHNLVKLNKNTF